MLYSGLKPAKNDGDFNEVRNLLKDPFSYPADFEITDDNFKIKKN